MSRDQARVRRRSGPRSSSSDLSLSESRLEDGQASTVDTQSHIRKLGRLSLVGRTRSAAMLLGGIYIGTLLALFTSHRVQCLFVYLHWMRPPQIFAPLDNLAPYRLDGTARVVNAGHLRGWHLLPPGPPFAPPPADKMGTDPARDYFFDQELRRTPNTRVVIFFHGNSGTRAFPFKRVDMLRLLGSNLDAHVVTFDYTGFGDSPGRPSEKQLYADAISVYHWVANRTSPSAQIVIYGQSLGSFAASHLAASVCPRESEGQQSATYSDDRLGADGNSSDKCGRLRAVVLDAAPASLYDASLSHASVAVFRLIPFVENIAKYVLHESHDSVKHCSLIEVPLLVLHGEKDALIPIEQGRRVYTAAVDAGNKHAYFVAFQNSGHNSVNAAPNYLVVLHEFLSKYLEPRTC